MQLRCNRFDDRPIIELSESFWALFTVGKFEKWEIWAKIAYFGDIDHFHASYHYWVTNWDRRLGEVSYES